MESGCEIKMIETKSYGLINWPDKLARETGLLSFLFWSGLRGSKAYSLWGGVIPSPSIGYDYL